MVDCGITKIVPTVISEVNEGVTLVCHNSKAADEDVVFIEGLLHSLGTIKHIREEDFGLASELTSCAPGFIAAIFREFTEAGLRHTESIGKEEIEELVLQTLFGTARLMLVKKMSFNDVISRVATRGGITEEGNAVIKAGIPGVFEEMFDRTMKKRNMVGERVEKEFYGI